VHGWYFSFCFFFIKIYLSLNNAPQLIVKDILRYHIHDCALFVTSRSRVSTQWPWECFLAMKESIIYQYWLIYCMTFRYLLSCENDIYFFYIKYIRLNCIIDRKSEWPFILRSVKEYLAFRYWLFKFRNLRPGIPPRKNPFLFDRVWENKMLRSWIRTRWE